MDDKVQRLERQLEELQRREKEWREKCQALTTKMNASTSGSIKKIEHSADFWTDLCHNCTKKTGPFGSGAIRRMIKTGKMTVHDTDPARYNRTLLIMAADQGSYNLAQFLMNNVCAYTHNTTQIT